MNKTERIKAAINGETPDKIPYSFWTHLPGIDLDPVKLAETTYEFYKKYDLDFIKTMNNGMYSVEDFGCEVDYSQIKNGGVAKIVSSPIHKAEDWGNIKMASLSEGALARELYSLELLLKKTKGEVPVIFTVFSPITTAEKISQKTILEHIAEGKGEYVHKALNIIAKTTCNLAKKAIEIGADGVFFASQLSSYDAMSEENYLEYGKPYDLMVLNSASKGWFNAIHAHGNNIMFDILKDYPVNAFNWHIGETLPDIDEASDMTGKCLMGGIRRMDLTNRNKNEVHNQIYNYIKKLDGKHQILTPGCVIRYPLDDDMLMFINKAKNGIEIKLKKC